MAKAIVQETAQKGIRSEEEKEGGSEQGRLAKKKDLKALPYEDQLERTRPKSEDEPRKGDKDPPTTGKSGSGDAKGGATPTVVNTPKVTKTYAQMMAMTLSDLSRYASEQADWANDPKLDHVQRLVIWRWVTFAGQDASVLSGCGDMKVEQLEQQYVQNGPATSNDLATYAAAMAGSPPSARLTAPASDIPTALKWGKALTQLEGGLGKPTVNRIFNQNAFVKIVGTSGGIDTMLDYNAKCAPVLDADNGEEINSILAMKADGIPYATYKTEIPEVRNFHRFEKNALKSLAANKKDKSKSKPLTLVLHSAMDHNGAFHRDPGLTKVLTDTRNLSLMIEGAETLEQVQSQIGPIVNEYGKDGKLDQVMFAGHGNARTIQLAGKMEQDGTTMKESNDRLRVGDKRSDALMDEVLKYMDKSTPHHRVVFNACLTNSNSVSTSDIKSYSDPGGKTAGDPAKAVQELIKEKPSLATYFGNRAKSQGKDIESLGANASIGTVSLIDNTGALDIKDPNDKTVTAPKIKYVEFGVEPTGVLRAVVESWANDKAGTLDAMKRRVAAAASTWQARLVKAMFSIILKNYADDVATINDFAAWASGLAEISFEEECRVTAATPVASLQKHMEDVFAAILAGGSFGGSPYVPLVLHQAVFLATGGKKTEFLTKLSDSWFDCQKSYKFLELDKLIGKSSDLLGTAVSGAIRGQTILALIEAGRSTSPNADAVSFVKTQAVSGDRLKPDAKALLKGRYSEDTILIHVGLKKAPVGTNPVKVTTSTSQPQKANVDTDGDGVNDTYVEPCVAMMKVKTKQATIRDAPSDKGKELGTWWQDRPVQVVGKLAGWYQSIWDTGDYQAVYCKDSEVGP